MDGRFDDEPDDPADTAPTPPENTIDSPLTGDEATYASLPKKSRRCAYKKVVEVPIGDGFRGKGDVYPPPDSWSWRKYGQKPIKGSPYPRGYYRCSSSKGCPARKQVERSRLDPTTLLITYSSDHNHPIPTTTTTTTKNPTTKHKPPSSPAVAENHTANFHPKEYAAFTNQPDIEPAHDGFMELAGEFGWLCDVGSTMMGGATLMVPTFVHDDSKDLTPMAEEDKLLFGDLVDLPESSVVSRLYRMETPCCDVMDWPRVTSS